MNDYDAYEDILIKDVMFTIVFAIIAVISFSIIMIWIFIDWHRKGL